MNQDIVLLTRIVRAECNPNSVTDKLYMVQLILNRKPKYGTISDVLSAPNQFNGYNTQRYWKELEMGDYYLIEWFIHSGIHLHDYTHVINPFIATNKSFRDYAVKQRGEWIHNHWYFME